MSDPRDDLAARKRSRLEVAARECGGFNEETYRSLPEWEQELWCARAWAAIQAWIER